MVKPFLKRRLFLLLLIVPSLFLCIDLLWPTDLEPRPGSRIVLSADNQPLRTFADDQGIWRYPISLDQVSPLYLEALVNYEDRYFYHHPGVNPLSLVRAFGQALKTGEIVSGGSTLTMQVARLRYPEPRTLWGKVKEIIRACQLELHYSKDDILTYYINHAPFGGTIEGVQAAALTYLGYDAKDLTHAQAALLAVLPQAPTRYRPDRNPTSAQAARDKVIQRLVDYQVWDEQIAQDAQSEQVTQSPGYRYSIAPILARRLASQSDSGVIHSTINLAWQQSVERLVKHYAQSIDQHVSVAVLIMNSKTGAVEVYSGSSDFHDNQRFGQVDMVQAIRSPGSTLKPFIYGMALDQGLVHSESLLMNVPLKFADYQPENFSGGFTGPESLSQSLAASLNVPAVQVLERVGPVPFYLALQQAGATLALPGNERPSLAIALGGLGTNLESLVRLMSALDNNGTTQKPRFLMESAQEVKPLLSPGAAWIIRDILARHASNPYGMAIKTGTSYGFRDSWAVGVVNGYTLGVWVGQPDGTPLTGHYGRQTAVPLLTNVASRILGQNPMPARPASVTQQKVCWPTGQPEENDLCDEAHDARILNQTIPESWMTLTNQDTSLVSATVRLRLARDSGLQVAFGCDLASYESTTVLWPAPLQLWLPEAYQNQRRLPVFDSRCARQLVATARLPFTIAGINEGDAMVVNEQTQGNIKVRAEGGQPPYYWYVNGAMMPTNGPNLSLTIEGEQHYEIIAMDYHGQIDRKQFNTYFSNSPPTDDSRLPITTDHL